MVTRAELLASKGKGQPTFTTPVAIQPTGVQDVASGYTAINNALSKFQGAGADVAEKVGEFKGVQEAKEHPKEFLGNGTPISPIAIAEREAAVQSQQANITTDIRNKVSQLETKWTSPKSSANPDGGISTDSLPNFQKEMESWGTGYFGEMMSPFKPTAQRVFASESQSAQNRLVRQTGTLVKNQQVADLTIGTNQTVESARNKAFSGDFIQSAQEMSDLDNRWQQLMNSGAVSKEKYANTVIPAFQKVKIDGWHGKIERAVASGKIEDIKGKIEKSKGLTPLEKDSLNGYVETSVGKFATASSARDAIQDQKMRESLQAQLNGAPEDSNLATGVARTDQKQAEGYGAASTLMQDTGTAQQQLRYQNFNLSQQKLNAIKLDPKDSNISYNQAKLQSLKNYVSNNKKAFLQDTAEYTKDAPQVQAAVRQEELSPGFENLSPDVQAQKIIFAKSDAQVALAKGMGATDDQITVLSDSDKQQLASLYTNADPKQQQDIVDSIADSYGPNADKAMRQMAKLGVPPNTILMAGLDKISNSRLYIPMIQTALAAKDKDLNEGIKSKGYRELDYETDGRQALSQYMNTIPANTVEGQNFRKSTLNAVIKGAKQLSITTGLDAADATKKMAQTIIYNRYSGFSGAARIRNDISLENARNVMTSMDPNTNRAVEFNPLNRVATTDERPEDVEKDDALAIRNGSWHTLAGDKGLFWTDANGIPVTMKGTNKRYEVLWDNLKTPGTTENKAIANVSRGTVSTFLSKLTTPTNVIGKTLESIGRGGPKFETPQNTVSAIQELRELNEKLGGVKE